MSTVHRIERIRKPVDAASRSVFSSGETPLLRVSRRFSDGFSISVTGAAALVIAMCIITGPSNRVTAATPAKDQAKYAVAADNDFAADLYRQLAKEQQGKNLFFSPYSMLAPWR